MKTNLNRKILTVEDAKSFLTELHVNGESFHPEDNAHEIVWNLPSDQIPTPAECDQLNILTDAMYSIEGNDIFAYRYGQGFDPCGFLIDLDNESKEFLITDKSGRGGSFNASYAKVQQEFKTTIDEEYEENEGENSDLYDFLHDGEVGASYDINNATTITRTK